MTMIQLRYAIVISQSASMKEAARKLYVSQPGLSASMKELEEELGFKIFERNNRGITVTPDGVEFLGYAKQVVSQYEIIEERYYSNDLKRVKFSVSMQHYVFAVHAFIKTLKKFSPEQYDFSVHETRTDEVLRDVKDFKSEVGVLAYSKSNAQIVKKIFKEYHLEFYPLMQRDTFIYLWKDHPLAGREEISIEELREYPCVSFEQGDKSSFYLKEEALSDYDYTRMIKTNDRATTMEILAGLNGYSVGTGIASGSVMADGLVCIKLKEEDPLTIGYLLRTRCKLSPVGEKYVEELKKYQEVW